MMCCGSKSPWKQIGRIQSDHRGRFVSNRFCCLSAFFSGSETGLYRVSRTRLVLDGLAGSRAARGIVWLLNHPSIFVATTLVGNNLANYVHQLRDRDGGGRVVWGWVAGRVGWTDVDDTHRVSCSANYCRNISSTTLPTD